MNNAKQILIQNLSTLHDTIYCLIVVIQFDVFLIKWKFLFFCIESSSFCKTIMFFSLDVVFLDLSSVICLVHECILYNQKVAWHIINNKYLSGEWMSHILTFFFQETEVFCTLSARNFGCCKILSLRYVRLFALSFVTHVGLTWFIPDNESASQCVSTFCWCSTQKR